MLGNNGRAINASVMTRRIMGNGGPYRTPVTRKQTAFTCNVRSRFARLPLHLVSNSAENEFLGLNRNLRIRDLSNHPGTRPRTRTSDPAGDAYKNRCHSTQPRSLLFGTICGLRPISVVAAAEWQGTCDARQFDSTRREGACRSSDSSAEYTNARQWTCQTIHTLVRTLV